MRLDEVRRKLAARARPDQLEGMARFGIVGGKRLGVSMPELRKLAREIGRDHALALKLWETGIQDARILASLVDLPAEVTEAQMEAWVRDLDSWDVCDQVCLNLFEKTPFARKKIREWSRRPEEFVKRAAFALLACVASHDRDAPDQDFLGFLSVIRKAAADERNFVKKAVNWALRNIGKRNPVLNRAAIDVARELLQNDSRAARWIASDAIRELESDAVRRRLESRKRDGAKPASRPRRPVAGDR